MDRPLVQGAEPEAGRPIPVAPHIKTALKSRELTADQPPGVRLRLNSCLSSDGAHIVPGSSGPEVQAIQNALKKISAARLDLALPDIMDKAGEFGDTTVAAVHRYKDGGNGAGDRIVRAGQPLDDIVGRMTITQIDDDLLSLVRPAPPPQPRPAPPPVTRSANAFVGHMGPAERRAHLILEYYTNCGLETVGPGQIQVTSVSRFPTFEGLIEALITTTSIANVVVNHGDTGFGLLIRLCPESQFRATGLVIGALRELADRRQKGPLNPSDPDTRMFLTRVMSLARVSQQVVSRIAEKLVKLRKTPRIIHLRACKMQTPFMAMQYKAAFGAITITFHGTRIIFQRNDPKIPVNHVPVAESFAKSPPNNQEHRVRLFEDPLGEFASMLIGMAVVLDENGNVQTEDSVQLIDRREAVDLEGWAQVLIRRWRAPVQKGFIIPIMWADEGETTFHCPLESGWRTALQIV
jgi:hypothetical protein